MCATAPNPDNQLAKVISQQSGRRNEMSMGMILLIIVVLVVVGVIPVWPHSRSWGYGPSGIVGAVLLILIILFLMGRI
jgi:Flp pilus assembly protein TadB